MPKKINQATKARKEHAKENGFENVVSLVKIKGGAYSIGKDKEGFFAYTHRARSKSYKTQKDIPQTVLSFIASTG